MDTKEQTMKTPNYLILCVLIVIIVIIFSNALIYMDKRIIVLEQAIDGAIQATLITPTEETFDND